MHVQILRQQRSFVACAICSLFSYIHSDRGTGFVSSEIKSFLRNKGISTSRITPYNPSGNGQVERYNGVIWKTISLCLKSRGLQLNKWEDVLEDALHSLRTLLWTATNCTPHERLFNYPRKSGSRQSVPSWLSAPGPVLLKRHVRQSKYEPFVDEVELLEANPYYAHVRLADGRESTVSVRHLAPVLQLYPQSVRWNHLKNSPRSSTKRRTFPASVVVQDAFVDLLIA